MAKFIYRLQTVLNIKKQLEKESKNQLAIQIRTLNDEQQKLSDINSKQNSCLNGIAKVSTGNIQVDTLRQYNTYLSALKKQLSEQENNVNKASENVDIYREKLMNAAKEKKTLELLKEKKHQAFSYNEMKKEEKIVDEVLSFKYMKK